MLALLVRITMIKRTYLSKDNTFQLINEVKQRPCLWNPDHEEYNGRYALNKAWEEISFTMDLPDTVLRTKWKNLRDMHRKELNKYPDEYTGTWRYYHSLSFLVLKTDAKENKENGTPENTDDSEDAPLPGIKCEPLQVFNEVPIPERKKKKKDETDFDMLFLESLTPYFKQLEPMRKLIVRGRIQDLLLNEIATQNEKNG